MTGASGHVAEVGRHQPGPRGSRLPAEVRLTEGRGVGNGNGGYNVSL